MRADATAERIDALLAALGRHARAGDRAYLTGGATAVLCGWRASTRDGNLLLEGDEDALLRALAAIKDSLDVNVELASPLDFLPVADDWRDRAVWVARHGRLDVFHFPFALQALAKLQRGFDQDLADVDAMLERGLTTTDEITAALDSALPRLYRFPSVDADRLARQVRSLAERRR